MTPMPITSFSMRMQEKLKLDMQAEAKRDDRSTSYIANKAIEEFINRRQFERKIMQERVQEAKKGAWISEKAMDGWINSWDTQEELPVPSADVFLN